LSGFVSWGMRRGLAGAGAAAALAGGSLAATQALAAQPLQVRRTVWHQP